MQRGNSNTPFVRLGKQLKHIRQDAKESLAEASGAVEIDLDTLERYERGEMRPSEDILLLLITHFDLSDELADMLWHLAGYDKKKPNTEDTSLAQQAVMILPLDARIIYTDMVNVTVNNFGVVMNFMQQGVGSTNGTAQPTAISRVGMSIEHAQTVLNVLQHSLDQAQKLQQPKQLPGAKQNADQSSN